MNQCKEQATLHESDRIFLFRESIVQTLLLREFLLCKINDAGLSIQLIILPNSS